MITNYNFYGYEKIKKAGKCPVCNRRATRTKDFTQSINPHNNKSIDQIYQEEKKKLKAWIKQPVYHSKCQPKVKCPICGWKITYNCYEAYTNGLEKEKQCPSYIRKGGEFIKCSHTIQNYILIPKEEDK